MADNDVIIKALRRGFEVDDRDQFTNCALVFAYPMTSPTLIVAKVYPSIPSTTMPTPKTSLLGTTTLKITPTITF